MEWFLKSIGVTDDLVQNIDQAQLAFQRPLVLWLGLLFVIPAAYFIYRRQRDNLASVPKRFRIALSVTRVLVLLLLVVVLAGPYLSFDEEVSKKPIVAVMLDGSQSMQLLAGPYASDEKLVSLATATGLDVSEGQIDVETRQQLLDMSRAELINAAMSIAYEPTLKPLEEDFDVRYYGFARQPLPVTFEESETPTAKLMSEGSATSQIGEAVYHVLDEAAGTPVSGILLFSDGQNTGGRSPSQAARAAADVNTPIIAMPLGSGERIKDVSIVDVYTSGLVAVGDMVGVNVTLESVGFDNFPVKVELKDGDEILDVKDVVVRDSEQHQVELTFEAAHAGDRYLTIHVPPPAEEVEQLHANNSDTAFVHVSEEKIRVLLLDGRPRWDFRFVKNAIRRDNGVGGRTEDQADVVVETEWRRLPDEMKSTLLPQTVQEWSRYHTVILGDVTPNLFNDAMQESLIKAVREDGVGLIVASGTESMPHKYDATFHELLPVRLRQGLPGQEAPVYKPFRMELTPAGMIHEALRLYDDPGRNREVWAEMPPYYWSAAVERPAPGATVLAANPSVTSRYGKMPLIAYHYAGDGKVMFVGTDSTWLWRQNVGDRFFYKFWGQAIRFVARTEEEDLQKNSIEVRPVRAQPGEAAAIELMAFHATGEADEAESKVITLLGPQGRMDLELTRDNTRPGRFTGEFTPSEPGVHRLAYQPSDGEAVEATLQVLISPEEYRHPNLNRPALELLANTTGGDVVELTDLATIPEKLNGEIELKQRHREASIWDNWLMLGLLMLIYCVDVGIRRLIGLS